MAYIHLSIYLKTEEKERKKERKIYDPGERHQLITNIRNDSCDFSEPESSMSTCPSRCEWFSQ